ncbi:MAG: permease [Elusimicrobia bacterium]|nr:permease [Candidatus Obscuribacterium magneticum]
MIIELTKAGMWALRDYIATHVLTCLVPAFLLAGAMVTFISREAILRYLNEAQNRWKAFSLAGLASFLLAACSCTVIPVAGGLYYSGAGIGSSFIVLWVAPAANILALVYTGNILGGKIVIARIVAALTMAYAVGFVMSAVFKEAPRPGGGFSNVEVKGPTVQERSLGLIVLIFLSLLLPNYLVPSGGRYLMRVLVWTAVTIPMAFYAWRFVPKEKIRAWMRETWWFVRLIVPLLLAGVFAVGVIGKLLPEAWIQRWLGGNGLMASFLATMIGAIAYFATMTEAPFVDMLMKLGMGKGPALALLLTGPGLSLPSWLAIARVFGVKKALVYVPTIVILGTLVGWVYGNWVP